MPIIGFLASGLSVNNDIWATAFCTLQARFRVLYFLTAVVYFAYSHKRQAVGFNE
jgi:hypothetical protein